MISGVVLAIAGTFLFAMKSIFIKFAFADGANATLLLMLRLLISMPFYCAMLIYLRRQDSGRIRPQTRHVLASIVLGFLGYYLASFLDMAGLERISAQLERLTLFTYPAIVSVLAWMFLGEQLNGRIIASIALCYVGLGVMYSQERTMPNSQDVGIGVFLVMGAAISYSVYVLFAKPLMQKIGSREFTSYAMIGSTAFMCVHFFATQSFEQLVSATPSVYAYGVALAFVCTVVPSFLVNEAIVRLGATRTTVIGSVGPVITMGLAIVLLGEPSSIYHVAGMVIVIFGVMLVAKKSS
jgi:drug/metabolite transporter (DMT)-like permease